MFACAPDDERTPQRLGCLCHTPAFARLNRRLSEIRLFPRLRRRRSPPAREPPPPVRPLNRADRIRQRCACSTASRTR